MRLVPTLIFLLSCVASCGRESVPDELLPIQGDWFFDEARSLEEHDRAAKSKDEAEKLRKFHALMKANGTPVKSDIVVQGKRIIGKGRLLQEQFDILEFRRAGDKLVCKALWHEDRHDPGDASTITLVLQVTEGTLKFWLEDEDEPPFFFKRKGQPK